MGGAQAWVASARDGLTTSLDNSVNPIGGTCQPRKREHTLGQASGHALHLLALARQSCGQQRIARTGGQHALVEHPGVGLDAGAA